MLLHTYLGTYPSIYAHLSPLTLIAQPPIYWIW